jgi:hypothetical protein
VLSTPLKFRCRLYDAPAPIDRPAAPAEGAAPVDAAALVDRAKELFGAQVVDER